MDLDKLGLRAASRFVRGSGSYLIDADGRRYLDFSSQSAFTNLGRRHPRIVAAIQGQADQLGAACELSRVESLLVAAAPPAG